MKPRRTPCVVLAAVVVAGSSALAQDLEPRRWTHLPVDTDVVGASYVFSAGDLQFDPVLRIEDAEVDVHTLLLTYTRYFALGERTARVDVVLPVQSGEWEGLVDGVPRAVERDGLADPAVRLSTNLIGAPALAPHELVAYRMRNPVTTTVGAALELRLPLGEYDEDRLINLGQNRLVLGTQLGVLHTRGEWSFELTGTAFLHDDNDEFFGDTELEQDPLFALQTHVVKTFGPDWWMAAGVAYAWEGESTIDGVAKDDERSNLLSGTSFGFRVGEAQSVRIGYMRTDTQADVGSDADSVLVGWSFRF